jgi:hypothetical protein
LDDEKVIVRSARTIREAVVLKLDTGVSLVIVLDDIGWHSKMLLEMSVVHGAFEHLWARPFRTEATSFLIITATMCHHPLGDIIGIPKVPTECLVGPTDRRLKSSPMRKPFLPPEPLG